MDMTQFSLNKNEKDLGESWKLESVVGTKAESWSIEQVAEWLSSIHLQKYIDKPYR